MARFRDAKSKDAKRLIHRRGSASRDLATRTASGSRGNGFRVTSGRGMSRTGLLAAIEGIPIVDPPDLDPITWSTLVRVWP